MARSLFLVRYLSPPGELGLYTARFLVKMVKPWRSNYLDTVNRYKSFLIPSSSVIFASFSRSYPYHSSLIRIITVYEPNSQRWNGDFTQRRLSDDKK